MNDTGEGGTRGLVNEETGESSDERKEMSDGIEKMSDRRG